MQVSKDQRGIAHVVLILIAVAVLALVVFAGYRVASRSDNIGSTSGQQTAKQTPVPDKIKTKADLSQASKALDTLPIDNDVNPNSLNSDINAIK